MSELLYLESGEALRPILMVILMIGLPLLALYQARTFVKKL